MSTPAGQERVIWSDRIVRNNVERNTGLHGFNAPFFTQSATFPLPGGFVVVSVARSPRNTELCEAHPRGVDADLYAMCQVRVETSVKGELTVKDYGEACFAIGAGADTQAAFNAKTREISLGAITRGRPEQGCLTTILLDEPTLPDEPVVIEPTD
jgi:hypothetical protein